MNFFFHTNLFPQRSQKSKPNDASSLFLYLFFVCLNPGSKKKWQFVVNEELTVKIYLFIFIN